MVALCLEKESAFYACTNFSPQLKKLCFESSPVCCFQTDEGNHYFRKAQISLEH